MIQGIFEIIQQDYVNDEEIKFIKDLVKVLFLTFDTFIVLNEFDLLIYFFYFTLPITKELNLNIYTLSFKSVTIHTCRWSFISNSKRTKLAQKSVKPNLSFTRYKYSFVCYIKKNNGLLHFKLLKGFILTIQGSFFFFKKDISRNQYLWKISRLFFFLQNIMWISTDNCQRFKQDWRGQMGLFFKRLSHAGTPSQFPMREKHQSCQISET